MTLSAYKIFSNNDLLHSCPIPYLSPRMHFLQGALPLLSALPYCHRVSSIQTLIFTTESGFWSCSAFLIHFAHVLLGHQVRLQAWEKQVLWLRFVSHPVHSAQQALSKQRPRTNCRIRKVQSVTLGPIWKPSGFWLQYHQLCSFLSPCFCWPR